jgi:hypothetical protein
VEAIVRVGLPAAREVVDGALGDPDGGVRRTARGALLRRFPDAALAGLAAAAGDPDWRVRAQVVDDALALRAREAVDALVTLVGDPVLRVATAAHDSLRALSGKDIGPDADLWRAWWTEAREAWRPPEGDLAEPAAAAGRTAARFRGVPVTTGRVAFVIDASGSMAEPVGDPGRTRWDAVREELVTTIRSLPPETLADVIVFDERVRAAFPEARPLGPKAVAGIERFLKKQSPAHRGDLIGGVRAALALEEVDTVFLFSDGAPTAGEIVDGDRIRAAVRRENRMLGRVIHAVGFRSVKGSPRRFLAGLARDSGGRSAFR